MASRGIINAKNEVVINPAERSLLTSAGAPFGFTLEQYRPEILTLSKFETKCLLIQLANLESNITSSLTSIGVPKLGIFKANINANNLVSSSNVATVTITNSDHSDINLGMIAQLLPDSVGVFGSNTLVVAKSVGGNIIAGNFVPGCTYTITSVGTTDFSKIGHTGEVTAIGNVFVANAAGSGTGTALGTNNQIIFGSNHTISGDVTFNVVPLKLGKYQTSPWLLTKLGYLETNGAWKNTDGVDSNDIFLAAPEVQDSVVATFLQQQYIELVKIGAIRAGDDKETVAGMLALAYQYQDIGNPSLNQNVFNSDGTVNLENYSIASRANVWRNTGQTVDSQGRPGHIYFNAGRYAVRTLGADVPE